MNPRGGPQVIPRPPAAGPGRPPPWHQLGDDDRRLTAGRLRRAFQGRVGSRSVVESRPGARGSGVLAPFYQHDNELFVVLTRRSWGLRAHTGEVSFPGGRCEPGEPTVVAAVREAEEEIALDPGTVEVLGELDHLMTVSSGSFIVPHVALLAGRPDLRANPDEVDAVLRVPARELLLDEVYREEVWRFATAPPWIDADEAGDGPYDRSIFFFELVGDTVWGATAAMLRQLLALGLGVEARLDHA